MAQQFEFDSTYEAEQILEDEIPEVTREIGSVIATHPDLDEPEYVGWRDPIFTQEEEPRLAGEVSSNENWYHVIQYHDIAQAALDRFRDHEIDTEGNYELSDSRHRFTGKFSLGEENIIEPEPGDKIASQLHLRAGHSGATGIKYQPGAVRLVCSNGMTGFVEDQAYEQTHSKPFQPQLAHHAVDSILEGQDEIENRIQEAQRKTLKNQDEAFLLLRDFVGIDWVLEDPTNDIIYALGEEVEDPENPSLYETFNAATYAIQHLSEEDTPEHKLDTARENAASLLEYGSGVPSARIMGENAVKKRADFLLNVEDIDEEQYYEDEVDDLRALMKEHQIQA